MRATRFHKSLRILAETNGVGLSTLEFRLRSGMSLNEALSKKTRRQITASEVNNIKHLTFTNACRVLSVTERTMQRLERDYEFKLARVKDVNSSNLLMIVWCAIHAPRINYKSMARFIKTELCLFLTHNQIQARLARFGLNTVKLKQDLHYYRDVFMQKLWSKNNE